MSEGMRTRTSQPKQRKWITTSLAFLFSSGSLQIGRCPPTLVKMMVTQFTDSNANLFWRSLTDILRYNVFLTVCAPLGPVKLIHKINHHITLTCVQVCLEPEMYSQQHQDYTPRSHILPVPPRKSLLPIRNPLLAVFWVCWSMGPGTHKSCSVVLGPHCIADLGTVTQNQGDIETGRRL